ncbi:unnamed protein product [Caenorhabditis angaria]|uniref:Uncharacterized protein n=1 Tax=Caenorhabditis angaria TaxID=860376 RepID=A0A9P1IPK7_9PELO|nr:unnamed protein product [Caenorhabditis angaria]
MKSQQQLNIVLLVQFTLPFLTIHIPFYLTFIMPLLNISSTEFSVYLPFLYSWCPALNPIIVLIMVKTIRDKILHPGRSSQVQSIIHIKQHT